MMFLELFVPRGAFGAEQLRELAGRLTMRQLLTHVDAIRDVVGGSEDASANAGVMDFIDSISHVVVHETGTWIVGEHALDQAEPPRYVARVHVPGPWRKSMGPFLIASITRAISQASPEPGRCYREPCVEVHVIGVPEGGYGIFGRVVGESARSSPSARPGRVTVTAAWPASRSRRATGCQAQPPCQAPGDEDEGG